MRLTNTKLKLLAGVAAIALGLSFTGNVSPAAAADATPGAIVEVRGPRDRTVGHALVA